MSETLGSIVELIHPAASGIGIITTDQVYVLFDREIDETTIAGGNFFLTGPDFDTWLGPDLQLFQEAASGGSGEAEILQSPGFQGIVQGIISFERISLSNLDVVTAQDTIGSGLLYRTKAIFTPTNRLAATTEYNVYLSGDEDDNDSLQTGISERTVFDTIASGTNLGTVDPTFVGGYIGLAPSDVFHVDVTTSGEVGDAKFTYYRDIDPLTVLGPFRTKRAGILLDDGVSIEFPETIYSVGDHWQAVVKGRTTFIGNLQWSFKTGSGSVQTIPDSTSTSVLGDPTPAVVAVGGGGAVSTFGITSSKPTDGASSVIIPPDEFTITAEFNEDIDLGTVTSGLSVIVMPEDVTGDIPPSGAILISEPSASGSTLSIVVAAGQLHQNELITVILDSTLASTGGTSLGADFSWSFSTQYSPMYCSLKRLRLDIGLFISAVADDTVNLAIHVASLEAEAMTWNKSTNDDTYYQHARAKWTCCRAAEILLINVTGGGGSLKSKKLGDLSVEYDTSGSNTNQALQRAIECQARWEGALVTGGRQVQKASMVVRGELDIDRPPVGRGWHHTSSSHPQIPAANRHFRHAGSRRFRNMYSRRGWWNK